MKRTLVLGFTVLFLICTVMTGFAAPVNAPEFSTKDISNDLISITGKTDKNEMVTLIILNPGKAAEDVDFSDRTKLASAVQYIASKWSEGNTYTFDVPLNGEEGGTFTMIVSAGGKEYKNSEGEHPTFDFYYLSVKEDIIGDINAETDDEKFEDLVKDAYEYYSLAQSPLYKKGDVDEIIKIVEYEKEEGAFDVSADSFEQVLTESMIVAAYNADKSDLLVGSKYLKYTGEGELDLESLVEYNDYKKDISADGLEKLHKDLIEGDNEYKTTEDIAEEFAELVAYYRIVDNVKDGYGHIEKYFDEDKYKDLYEDYGFKISELKRGNKNSVYSELLKADTNNIEELKDAFNDLVDESNNGGGDDDKGGSSSGTGTGFRPSAVTSPVDVGAIKPAAFFVDLENVAWASEQILFLAEKGVVNGVGNNNFAPNANVTRAEFLKMLLAALEFEANETTTAFKDVTAKWAIPYVAAAVKGGITSGVSAEEFAPDANVTREQSAAFICRALKSKGIEFLPDENVFSDNADISPWAVEEVNKLKKSGAIKGSGDGKFRPQSNLTRAEAAVMIYNILNIQ